MPEETNEEKTPTHFYVRTKRKDTEYRGDLHYFTNKPTKVPAEEIRAEYQTNTNLEISETASK